MHACLLLWSAVVGCDRRDPSFLLCVGTQWVWIVATKGEALRCWFLGAGGQAGSVCSMDAELRSVLCQPKFLMLFKEYLQVFPWTACNSNKTTSLAAIILAKNMHLQVSRVGYYMQNGEMLEEESVKIIRCYIASAMWVVSIGIGIEFVFLNEKFILQ